MGKVLVTGGAGYIGSHVVQQLGKDGYDVVVYDNCSTGSRECITHGEFILGDLADARHLSRVFSVNQFDAVLHFAASIIAPESVNQPLKYYANNTGNTLTLLQCCKQFNVNQIIFSSTAAVYGEPEKNPVSETARLQPMNPYGASKFMSEQIIRDYSMTSLLRYVILRYFNVAGADPSGKIGPSNTDSTQLIRLTCDAVLGKRPGISIFGTDFPTPDGTAIRDYIHVEDLSSAHLAALRYLEEGGDSQVFNCGYGEGFSVREVIERAKDISQVDFPVFEEGRRLGDPALVVACADNIRKVLGWKPNYNDLNSILKSALDWERKRTYIHNQETQRPDCFGTV